MLCQFQDPITVVFAFSRLSSKFASCKHVYNFTLPCAFLQAQNSDSDGNKKGNRLEDGYKDSTDDSD